MNPLKELLSGGVSGIFSGVKEIIGQFVADPAAKLAATEKIAEIETGFREKQIEAEQQFAEAQKAVIIAEAQSDSWLTKSWRPITMLVMLGMVVYNIVVIGTVATFFPQFHPLPIPPDAWELLKLGIGGYIGARTVEKVSDRAPDIIAAIKQRAAQ
jgi:hypothetical protein